MLPQRDKLVERSQPERIAQLEAENKAFRAEIVSIQQQKLEILNREKTIQQYAADMAALNEALQTEVWRCQQTEAALDESERLFYYTFEQAAVGMAIDDLDGRWLRVNQRFCDMVGYSETELMALTFADITHPDDLATDLALIPRLIRGELPFYQNEKRYICQDGSLLWASITVSAVCDATRKPVCFITTMQDISQRKEAKLIAQGQQMALQSSLAYLATEPELNNFLGQVLATVVEQFNAPIADIWIHDVEQTVIKLHLTHWNTKLLRNQPDALNQSPIPLSAFEQGSAWESLVRQQPFVYSDLPNHPDLKLLRSLSAVRDGVQTMALIPLVCGDGFLGTLTISYLEGYFCSSEYLHLLAALGQQVVLAIQLTRLAEDAKQVAVVEEHNRMAREIHDTLAQTLNSISLQLNNAQYYSTHDPAIAWDIIEQAKNIAHSGLIEARRSVWSLHPDAEQYRDLAGSLERALTLLTLNAELQVSFKLVGRVQPVPPDIGMNLLRIGQEAITNSLRYAQAQNLEVELSLATDMITLRIEDNGKGFNPQLANDHGGFGLVSMQQRCQRLKGQFTLRSQPEQGTCIIVQISLTSPSS
ncbi:GAF domain-containing sensor histidine kinase [Pleurocapsa sp. FMAR1]|uniref:GAF domain-containing sensor histidine kinase n=1 Tax=Pleurocapsa sp. FMAR1 TaxID=3040204 RepID=UPI0029C902E0|nr:PAS domain S-box protein [Pleurocapsa sp. FMAR1]